MAKITSYTVAEKTGLLSKGEVDILKKYARKLPENPIVVIIGAGAGTSSMAIMEERKDAYVYSIDTVFPTGGRYEPGEKENLKSSNLWDTRKILQLLAKSQDLGKVWSQKNYDLIFIDGDHRYEGIKQDILAWEKHANDGAFLIFHDYATPEVKPRSGVKRAVDELLLDNYDILDYERYTLVLRRRKEPE